MCESLISLSLFIKVLKSLTTSESHLDNCSCFILISGVLNLTTRGISFLPFPLNTKDINYLATPQSSQERSRGWKNEVAKNKGIPIQFLDFRFGILGMNNL